MTQLIVDKSNMKSTAHFREVEMLRVKWAHYFASTLLGMIGPERAGAHMANAVAEHQPHEVVSYRTHSLSVRLPPAAGRVKVAPIDPAAIAKTACDLTEALYAELRRRDMLPMLPKLEAIKDLMQDPNAPPGLATISLEDEA